MLRAAVAAASSSAANSRNSSRQGSRQHSRQGSPNKVPLARAAALAQRQGSRDLGGGSGSCGGGSGGGGGGYAARQGGRDPSGSHRGWNGGAGPPAHSTAAAAAAQLDRQLQVGLRWAAFLSPSCIAVATAVCTLHKPSVRVCVHMALAGLASSLTCAAVLSSYLSMLCGMLSAYAHVSHTVSTNRTVP